MRKSGLLFIVLLFGISTITKAQFSSSGGSEEEVSVQEIKDLKDEASVTLVGHIVKELGDDHYTFKDDTGEIEIEVDEEVWRGQEVTPEMEVRIQGEVDKDFTTTTIEVNQVTLTSKDEKQGW